MAPADTWGFTLKIVCVPAVFVGWFIVLIPELLFAAIEAAELSKNRITTNIAIPSEKNLLFKNLFIRP